MKRLALTITLLTVAVGMQAQEQKKPWSLDYEVGLGISKFHNYSALSLTDDATASYTAPTASFTLGMRRNDGFSLGLRYSNTTINTAAAGLSETATLHNFSLVVRRSAMLSEHVELYGSATLGFAILHNHLVYGGDDLDRNRYGMSSGLEAGLRYYFNKNAYFFISASIGAVSGLSKKNDLPAGLLEQTRTSTASSNLMGGFGIGLKPKVKKLNMPAEVIDRKESLQMAHYTSE